MRRSTHAGYSTDFRSSASFPGLSLLNDSQSAQLAEKLAEYGLELPPDRLELLDRYRAALWRWNEQLNLTRHTTLDKFVGRDVVDSMQLAQLLRNGERVLDVGTGGGVPGLVLAICRPDLRVSVCESTQKKARVAQAIVQELELPVQVHACRAEEVLELQTFDTLTVRGVAALSKLLTWLKPYWEAFDCLLLVKGQRWVEERGEARHMGLMKSLELRKAASYLTRDTGAESVILSIRRQDGEDSE
jgi:16S rRNA (guanine527-N7)-methyltransferase